MKVLAGDIGGTKTVLSLYGAEAGGLLVELRKESFSSGQHDDFHDLLLEFLSDETDIDSACFGVAGPVDGDRCVTTNLPWVIQGLELSQRLSIPSVHLLNDLEAAAYGMLMLTKGDFVELNPKAEYRQGHFAVIAAGTGLGEAIVCFDGKDYIAMPSEGGHCDFAPHNSQEDQLLIFLRERFKGHVSVERILAGDGFGCLYDFLKETEFAPPDPDIEARMRGDDRNAVISRSALETDDRLCNEVMRMFCRLYGAEAGNLALKCLPLGGLYIGGGIGPKIRPALEAGTFMQGFLDKGRLAKAIETIPVRLATNADAPLLGAAYMAEKMVVNGKT